jgi:hypothetical protein
MSFNGRRKPKWGDKSMNSKIQENEVTIDELKADLTNLLRKY